MTTVQKQISINPQYNAYLPELSEDAYKELKQSIKEHGLYIAITINQNGVLLDGHHRYRVCQELGIEPRFDVIESKDEYEEKRFVIHVNLKRRQLSTFQKYKASKQLLEIEREEARHRHGKKSLPDGSDLGEAVAKVAKEVGLSTRQFYRCEAIDKHADAKTKDRLCEEQTTVSKEYGKVKTQLHIAEKKEDLSKTTVKLPDSVNLRNCDFRDRTKNEVADNCVGLLITDPPYRIVDLPIYVDLAKEAVRVLRPGRAMVCYVANHEIGKIINMVENEGLTYHWACTIVHTGRKQIFQPYHVKIGSKPMLVFSKGEYYGKTFEDTIISEYQGKELHKWAQSTIESDAFIENMTEEGEIVYDPMLGQGTFGISAIRLKR